MYVPVQSTLIYPNYMNSEADNFLSEQDFQVPWSSDKWGLTVPWPNAFDASIPDLIKLDSDSRFSLLSASTQIWEYPLTALTALVASYISYFL